MDNYYYNCYYHLVAQIETFKDQQIKNVSDINKLNQDILDLYKVIQKLLKSQKYYTNSVQNNVDN